MQALLLGLPGTGRLALRDHALLLFLYNTGARVQEVADLRVGHLELREAAVVRLHGKGDKWRTCPLWRQTAQLLAVVLDTSNEPPTTQAPVFCSAPGQALTRFGIDKIVRRHTGHLDDARTNHTVSPHIFRHTSVISPALDRVRDVRTGAVGHVPDKYSKLVGAPSYVRPVTESINVGSRPSARCPRWTAASCGWCSTRS